MIFIYNRARYDFRAPFDNAEEGLFLCRVPATDPRRNCQRPPLNRPQSVTLIQEPLPGHALGVVCFELYESSPLCVRASSPRYASNTGR